MCYNHARFVSEAIDSVMAQTHPFIQLIVMDDGSTDNSVQVIEKKLSNHPDVLFIKHHHNIGYCASLNEVLKHAKGEFIIDLAADDVLLPDRIEMGLREMNRSEKKYNITFSDAILINEVGDSVGLHSQRFPHASIPQGDIYCNLISQFFICPPTLMFRKSVLEQIGGYDETLAFEDFDFLIRASRVALFCYSPKPLMKRRIVANSMANQQFKRNSAQRWSTYAVCKKIRALNRLRKEDNALIKRLLYEVYVSFRLFEIRLALKFLQLLFSVVFTRHHA
jgi:glycosyltransferase involved in cell wall biosynthesis